MGTLNEDKGIRAQRIAKAWQKLHYSNGPVNCGNCAFANKDKWSKTSGECTFIKGLPFPVSALGICKQHSNFRDK